MTNYANSAQKTWKYTFFTSSGEIDRDPEPREAGMCSRENEND